MAFRRPKSLRDLLRYEHDSNQTLMITTKMVNVDPVAEKDVNAVKK